LWRERLKFVHLAPREAVGRIRHNGLRLGGGREGRGVYAVPLVMMRRLKEKDPDGGEEYDITDPVSTAAIWRAVLFTACARWSRRGLRPVAVVFELPKRFWPVDFYLQMWGDTSIRVVSALQERPIPDLDMSPRDWDWAVGCIVEHYGFTLHSRPRTPAALGALLHYYQSAGGVARGLFSDEIEAVIREPIPASAIRRLVPLSQTNVEAKRRRNRPSSPAVWADDVW